AGLDMSSKVKDVIYNGGWAWPIELSSKYPLLSTIVVPTVSTSLDTLEWHSDGGVSMPFSVATVWNCLRPRDAVVPWYNVVWFNYCIPRHAFHMWLAVTRRPKTLWKLFVYGGCLIL
ncbi:putative reverse transcriptase domain-containing protein, partial [Tanacetum coccineum]